MKITKILTTALIAIMLFSLSACGNMHTGKNGLRYNQVINPFAPQVGQKAQAGAILGGAFGALLGQIIGKNTTGTLIGLGAGLFAGYIIGNEMDKADAINLNNAYERVADNASKSWTNPNNGEKRIVTIQSTIDGDNPCRVAEVKSTIDGKWQTLYVAACRDSRGHWQLQPVQ